MIFIDLPQYLEIMFFNRAILWSKCSHLVSMVLQETHFLSYLSQTDLRNLVAIIAFPYTEQKNKTKQKSP